MPITPRKKFRRSAVISYDASVVSQGVPPYVCRNVEFSPVSGSQFVEGSNVIVAVTPLYNDPRDLPFTYTWYSASVDVTIDPASASFNFGAFAYDETLEIAVDVINARGTNSFTSDYYISHGPSHTPTPTPTATATPTPTVTMPEPTPTPTATTPEPTPTPTAVWLPTLMTFVPSTNETWSDGTDFNITGSAVDGTGPFTYQWFSASVSIANTNSASFGIHGGPQTASFTLDVMSAAASSTASFTWTGKIDGP